MGLIFGGAHQLSMVCSPIFHRRSTKVLQITAFALYYLCKYPEYVAAKTRTHEPINYDQMQLMDSFLRETARLNPTTIRASSIGQSYSTPDHSLVSMPRKVLSPFKFADGTIIAVNNWIAVPQQALMQDEAHYEDPLTFNNFRFVNSVDRQDPSARFSSPSLKFPIWGGTQNGLVSLATHYSPMAVPDADSFQSWQVLCFGGGEDDSLGFHPEL